MSTTLKERTGEWVESNPLRRWRQREGLSMMDASALLSIGMSTVQHWETGAHHPSPAKMERLASAFGVQTPTLARTWREWYDRRPTP